MKYVVAVSLFCIFLIACGGGGSSSSRTDTATVNTPPSLADPEPAPVPDVADYQLAETAKVLAEVDQRLRGLPLAQFFEEAYRVTSERDPEGIISAGLAAAFQPAELQLTNISDEYYFQTVEIQKRIRDLLLDIDRGSLSTADQLSYDVYRALLEFEVEGAQYRSYQYPGSYGFWGWPGNTEQFFTQLAPLNTAADAESYIVLLNQLGRRFRQIEDLLDARAAAGVREPSFTFDFSRSLVANIASSTARNTAYYSEFSTKLAALDTVSRDEKDDLRDRALQVIEQRVLPAYSQLAGKMADMLPQAPENIGFGQFEGGDAFYRYALRFFTSSDQTPDEIHALGLAQLARIHAEMRVLFDQLAYPQDESLADLLARVDVDGGTVNGGEAVAFFENIIALARAELIDVFAQLPTQQVRVIGGPTGGFYIRGSEDGSRPGAFYAQTNSDLSYATMPTLAYHEAIPGHHLQIALAQELDLPRFRRDNTFTSYVEGWGLYAERLASDLGWYEFDAYGDLGRLRFEAMRAARLVLDTGIHAMGWTVEQAQQFNLENVGDNGSIARYSVSPGQASAYMTGMLKILELRQRSQQQLGELYDIADFHSVVVGNGSMPLNLLEGAVDHYIAETLAAAE